jgi:hypothetical protein
MILVTRSGQLGNQIFQLAHALSRRTPGEQIYIANMNEFARCFELPPGVTCFTLPGSVLTRLLVRGLVLRSASGLRLMSRIEERQDAYGQITETRHTRGLLPITWISGGFYQDCRAVAAAPPDFPRFRADIIAAARRWLGSHAEAGKRLVFCHLRRADYLNFHLQGTNLALPLSYYTAALQRLLADPPSERCGNVSEGRADTRILLASDDIEFVELAFANWQNTTVIREDPYLTLAIMSLCDAGVISNSSLSWWAGQFVVRRGGRVMAPRNWLGWVNDVCEPAHIEDPAFEWFDVPHVPRAINDCRRSSAGADA